MMPITCKEATTRSILRPRVYIRITHQARLQDYGFDYSDDDGNDAGSADVENMYYTAKCEYGAGRCTAAHAHRNTAKKEDNPEQALKEFRAIVEQEEEKGDWYVLVSLTHRMV